MARTVKHNKPTVAQVDGVELSNLEGQSVLLWKVSRPLTEQEHEGLSQKLRYEAEKSGINIVLVPFSIDAEVTTRPADISPVAETPSVDGTEPAVQAEGAAPAATEGND